MLVKDWMSKSVIAVEADDSMQDAVKLLKEHNIRMLPVLENNKLAGVVTDRDIKRASASDATTLEIHELLYLLSSIKVRDVMTKNPVTVPVDYTVEETAQVLLNHKISGVPVVSAAGDVVGIITQDDLFRVIISLTGVNQKGIQFALETEDIPGTITEIVDIIKRYGGRILSILSSKEQAPEGFRRIYIRTYNISPERKEALTEVLKNSACLIYMVDHRDNRRIIF